MDLLNFRLNGFKVELYDPNADAVIATRPVNPIEIDSERIIAMYKEMLDEALENTYV